MISVNLSWMIGIGSTYHRANSQDLSLDEILDILKKLASKSGIISIDVINPPKTGSQSLQARAARGNFIIMLTDLDDDEYDIRTYLNPCAKEEKIDILGEIWDSKSICTDCNIVIEIVRDFLETGEVSMDLLN
jgi:hypothetical protein